MWLFLDFPPNIACPLTVYKRSPVTASSPIFVFICIANYGYSVNAIHMAKLFYVRAKIVILIFVLSSLICNFKDTCPNNTFTFVQLAFTAIVKAPFTAESNSIALKLIMYDRIKLVN